MKKAGETEDDAGEQKDAEQNDTSAVTEPPDPEDILAGRAGGENAIDA